MSQSQRIYSVLFGLIFILSSLSFSSANDDIEPELNSDFLHGTWVNETLLITGTTSLPAQQASWKLYDITDGDNSTWELLDTGDYFSNVTPMDQDLWSWTISINVSEINCTCRIEISQPYNSDSIFLHRVVFIGIGPHKPVILPQHESEVIVDEPETISFTGVQADGDLDQSSIFLQWCNAPTGACLGETFDLEISPLWSGDTGSFSIDSVTCNLTDGSWKFSYYLRDEALLDSLPVTLTIHVDNTDPVAILTAPKTANESDSILVDGTASRDGFWGNSLQANWYLVPPNGEMRVAESDEMDGLILTFTPDQAGNWTIKLDITDMVGRRSSTQMTIGVQNLAPTASLKINGFDSADTTSYEFMIGEEMNLNSSSTDCISDIGSLEILWVVDGESYSNLSNLNLSSFSPGTYQIEMIVTDNDGISDSISLSIKIAQSNEESDNQLGRITAVIVVPIIPLLLFYLYKRFSKSDNSEGVIPKWNKSIKVQEIDDVDNDSKAGDLWENHDITKRDD